METPQVALPNSSKRKRLCSDWREHGQFSIASEVHRQARTSFHTHCGYGQEIGGSYGRMGRKKHVRTQIHGHLPHHVPHQRRRRHRKGILAKGNQDKNAC